jgi:glycosyltransferase involved in cell wall biosynthesis
MLQSADDMISVVMPVYNCERFVGAAIESILRQTSANFEFIIVDDGSTDRSREIISSYARRDSRIRVVNKANGGIARAINQGIDAARFDWIAIMHADDIALPQRLELQMAKAKGHPNVVGWGGFAYHIDEKGKTLALSKLGPTTEDEFYTRLRQGEPILVIHTTAFIQKHSFIAAGGYDPTFQCSEDLEFFDRLSLLGPLLAIPEPIALYRIHSSSNTMKRFREQRMEIRFIYSRQRARAQGKEEPEWEDFAREYLGAPLSARLRRRIDYLAQFYYRKFGVAISEEAYVGAIRFLTLAALLSPRYAASKAWNQRFSRSARKALRARKFQEASRSGLKEQPS